ncbi:hypothetical protein HDV64DRAFT_80063 [Trichoderma sp. TUCIM 5745]
MRNLNTNQYLNGWEWAWMDTCCIDKTNTSNTEEAINSMFRWYRNAGVCYAYLADVDCKDNCSVCETGCTCKPPPLNHWLDEGETCVRDIYDKIEKDISVIQLRKYIHRRQNYIHQREQYVCQMQGYIGQKQKYITHIRKYIAQGLRRIAQGQYNIKHTRSRSSQRFEFEHLATTEFMSKATDTVFTGAEARLISTKARLIGADASLEAACASLEAIYATFKAAKLSLEALKSHLKNKDANFEKIETLLDDPAADAKTTYADAENIDSSIGMAMANAGIETAVTSLEDTEVVLDAATISLDAANDSLDDVYASLDAADMRFADLNNASSTTHHKTDSRVWRQSHQFINARWFTRGWTLQELLAPCYLVFIDQAWHLIGTRESQAKEIENALGIETQHLKNFNPTDFESSSIAMRLSWASQRQTTREEDETYSLIGLFGISMPLIYGEGRQKAFDRFQRELITLYDDDSIFAWKNRQAFIIQTTNSMSIDSKYTTPILARSIQDFQHASKILQNLATKDRDFHFSITNGGLRIKRHLWAISNSSGSNSSGIQLVMGLNCIDYRKTQPQRIGIPLELVNEEANLYTRETSQLVYMETNGMETNGMETPTKSSYLREQVNLEGDVENIASGRMRITLQEEISDNLLSKGMAKVFITTATCPYREWPPGRITCSLKCFTPICTGKMYYGDFSPHARETRETTLRLWTRPSRQTSGDEVGDGEFDITSDRIYIIELHVPTPELQYTTTKPDFIIIIEREWRGVPIVSVHKPSDVQYIIGEPWKIVYHPALDVGKTELDMVKIYLRPAPSLQQETGIRLGNVPKEVNNLYISKRYILEISTKGCF